MDSGEGRSPAGDSPEAYGLSLNLTVQFEETFWQGFFFVNNSVIYAWESQLALISRLPWFTTVLQEYDYLVEWYPSLSWVNLQMETSVTFSLVWRLSPTLLIASQHFLQNYTPGGWFQDTVHKLFSVDFWNWVLKWTSLLVLGQVYMFQRGH